MFRHLSEAAFFEALRSLKLNWFFHEGVVRAARCGRRYCPATAVLDTIDLSAAGEDLEYEGFSPSFAKAVVYAADNAIDEYDTPYGTDEIRKALLLACGL